MSSLVLIIELTSVRKSYALTRANCEYDLGCPELWYLVRGGGCRRWIAAAALSLAALMNITNSARPTEGLSALMSCVEYILLLFVLTGNLVDTLR